FAALPAAYAWTHHFRLLTIILRSPLRATLAACGILAALAFAGRDLVADWSERYAQPPTFTLGLGADRLSLIETLKQSTTPDARILWEDLRGPGDTRRWTTLLPILTN